MATQKLPYRIKGCGCDCATMPADPCVPCNAGAFQLQCRSRSGTATLCGFPEYTTPSIPPRAYLQKMLSGANWQVSYDGLGCSGSELGRVGYVYSGACEYNPATCTLAVNGLRQQYSLGSLISEIPTCSISALQCSATPQLTRTSKTYVADTPCTDGGGFSNGCESDAKEQLSQEDTEEAAMARVTPVWTAWGAGGCCTEKELRGAGVFTFNFTEAEYRIRFAGIPGTTVMVELTFSRTPGSDYTIIVQDTATSLTFPTDPEQGWSADTIRTASGVRTCLAGSRLYIP